MAGQADHVVELDTSHSPMLSQPGLVADVLADLAAKTDAAASEGVR
jgi:pimeloyl-ACP methyl ester carboxylesterase